MNKSLDERARKANYEGWTHWPRPENNPYGPGWPVERAAWANGYNDARRSAGQ